MIIGRASAADPLGVGFVYVGPVEDFGWTHAHDVGRKAIESELGDQVKTTFVESVKEGPDSERVIAELASKGGRAERLMIDATHLKAHRTAASLLKKGLFPDVSGARRAA